MTVTLTLHGPFSACDRSGAALNVSARGAAILAVLAHVGRPGITREQLAALIWSGRGEEQARASLRQELSALRRALPGEVVMADRARVWLAEGAVTVAPCEGAAGYLEDVTLKSEAFEDWRREARAADIAMRLSTRISEAQTALARGDHAAARTAAEAVLALDPVQEAAARVLIEAESALGNRGAAMAAFQRLDTALRRELDVAPSATTLALVEALKAGEGAAALAQAKPTGPRGLEKRPTLAVLPFQELGQDPGDMFADGIVEELTGALSRVDAFDVIARQSAYALGAEDRAPQAAAAKLGADYLVEGSLRRAGTRLRLSVSLIGGESGVTHWAERFDDNLDDIFDVQDRIAAQVTGHLAPHLRNAEIARAHQRPGAERTGYEQFLSALPHFWAHRKEENLLALAHLDEALRLSRAHPRALAYKSWALAQKCSYLWSDDPAADKAAAMALMEEALPQADNRSDVFVACSATAALSASDFERAVVLCDRALALDPNNAWAWMRAGWNYSYMGHLEQSLAAFDRAEQLSPLDPFFFNVQFGRATALRAQGHYDEAVALIEDGMRAGSGVTWAYRMLAGTLKLAGREAEARVATRRWREAYPQVSREVLLSSLPAWRHDDRYIQALHALADEAL